MGIIESVRVDECKRVNDGTATTECVAVERDVLRAVDFNDVINDCARMKARNASLQT